MTIELIDDNKIKITLDNNDMQRLDISYSELDYASMNTRRIVWTLLCEAKNTLNLDLDLFSKMMIEVLPESDSGCTILFTVLDDYTISNQSKILVRKNIKPCIYEFSDVNLLISAFEKVFSIVDFSFENCELYLMDNKYRLIIGAIGRLAADLPDFFTEFGVYIGEGKSIAAYTREHGKLIADAENIKKMVSVLSH